MKTTWRVSISAQPEHGYVWGVARSIDIDVDGELKQPDHAVIQEIAELAFTQVQQWLALRAPK